MLWSACGVVWSDALDRHWAVPHFSSRGRWAGSWAQLWPKTSQKPQQQQIDYIHPKGRCHIYIYIYPSMRAPDRKALENQSLAYVGVRFRRQPTLGLCSIARVYRKQRGQIVCRSLCYFCIHIYTYNARCCIYVYFSKSCRAALRDWRAGQPRSPGPIYIIYIYIYIYIFKK